MKGNVVSSSITSIAAPLALSGQIRIGRPFDDGDPL
jgi:hypothetical protein